MGCEGVKMKANFAWSFWKALAVLSNWFGGDSLGMMKRVAELPWWIKFTFSPDPSWLMSSSWAEQSRPINQTLTARIYFPPDYHFTLVPVLNVKASVFPCDEESVWYFHQNTAVCLRCCSRLAPSGLFVCPNLSVGACWNALKVRNSY